jgi:hypothetical protein
MRSALPTRIGTAVLLTLVALLLGVVIITPIALSSQDLISWAAAPTGLHLPPPWPWLVFISLDAAAGVCVLLSVYCAWRGEPAGIFGLLVWVFALGSAFANYRHATVPGAAPDAVWFFPAMSIAGPALLDTVLARLRRWIQRQTGRRGQQVPAFGWRRWIPGIGALRDTYGAWRTALLLGITGVDEAITSYHRLCPDGSLRVAAALRARDSQPPEAVSGPPERPATADNGHIPVDLMRRIPIDPTAYQHWQTVWAELRDGATDLDQLANTHNISRRQVEFIRRAGEKGLLQSAEPTAVYLAGLADGHRNHSALTASNW